MRLFTSLFYIRKRVVPYYFTIYEDEDGTREEKRRMKDNTTVGGCTTLWRGEIPSDTVTGWQLPLRMRNRNGVVPAKKGKKTQEILQSDIIIWPCCLFFFDSQNSRSWFLCIVMTRKIHFMAQIPQANQDHWLLFYGLYCIYFIALFTIVMAR